MRSQSIRVIRAIRGEAIMPIYEFACPKCRRIFSFLSKRVNPNHLPACPKCGNKKLSKQVSRFALSKGLKEPAAKGEMTGNDPPLPAVPQHRPDAVALG